MKKTRNRSQANKKRKSRRSLNKNPRTRKAQSLLKQKKQVEIKLRFYNLKIHNHKKNNQGKNKSKRRRRRRIRSLMNGGVSRQTTSSTHLSMSVQRKQIKRAIMQMINLKISQKQANHQTARSLEKKLITSQMLSLAQTKLIQ